MDSTKQPQLWGGFSIAVYVGVQIGFWNPSADDAALQQLDMRWHRPAPLRHPGYCLSLCLAKGLSLLFIRW